MAGWRNLICNPPERQEKKKLLPVQSNPCISLNRKLVRVVQASGWFFLQNSGRNMWCVHPRVSNKSGKSSDTMSLITNHKQKKKIGLTQFQISHYLTFYLWKHKLFWVFTVSLSLVLQCWCFLLYKILILLFLEIK